MIVKNITNHKIIISIRLKKGDLRPKKRADQSMLSASCIEKKVSAFLFDLAIHAKYNAIPINKKRVVQTGAKIQLGGAMLGFCNPAYHVGIEGVVNIEPINPAS